jgi:hypothetical protein
VTSIGSTEDILERFYVISPERRIRNPAVAAISGVGRGALFA